MSVFGELLAIKTFREGKAELAVRRQRLALAHAVSECEVAQRRLAQFRAHAQREEHRLFDDLCGAIVVLQAIQDVYQSVAAMRLQEHDHAELLDQAQAQQAQEQQMLDDAREVHAQATRMKEKFVELASAQALEQHRELERKEDAEMEEVAETRKSRLEWDAPEVVE